MLRDRENVFVITRVRYIGFCSIHFTVTLIGRLKNTVRYSGDFVLKKFVISGFHCIYKWCIWMKSYNIYSSERSVLLTNRNLVPRVSLLPTKSVWKETLSFRSLLAGRRETLGTRLDIQIAKFTQQTFVVRNLCSFSVCDLFGASEPLRRGVLWRTLVLQKYANILWHSSFNISQEPSFIMALQR